MSITLYFSKLNVNSHIFNVYEAPEKLKQIQELILINIREDIEFEQEELRTHEDGESFVYKANYRFNSIEKMDASFNYAITGNLVKKSNLFVNELNEITGELTKIPVENTEVIQFYFDVYKETIAFYRTNRFGYNQFNLAFENLLNQCMSTEDEKYYFKISLCNEGLNLEEIESELKKLGKLEKLIIQIIPPNPNSELLNKINLNGEELLVSYNEGNITTKSTLFISKTASGLNLDATGIKDELDNVGKIHSELSTKDAIKNGYLTVDAWSKSGRFYTTKNNRPIKDTLEEKPNSIYTFAQLCKGKMNALFLKS
ncbi:MAG: hypothetical protein APF81_09055 [Desulfosporosinus sp. BRH_c37]|nr:MAG: hypothetical protein APF81_09055 [Desulfosporosinus sp. BRH_c37]